MLGSLWRAIFGHTIELMRDPEKTIFTDLTQEALHSEKGVVQTFGGILGLYQQHIFVIVNENVREVSKYPDPQAQSLFKPMLAFLENEFVINHNEPLQVKRERREILSLMLPKYSLGPATVIFEKWLSMWDPNKTISEQIDAACIDVVTQMLYEIALEPEEIERLVPYTEAGEKVVFNSDTLPKDKFDQLKAEFKELSDELVDKYRAQIENPESYLGKGLVKLREKDPTKKAEDLNPFLNLIVIGNVASLLKGMMILLAAPDQPFFETLKKENADRDAPISIEDLRNKSCLLYKLWLEGLRYWAPAGPVPRFSSLPGQLGDMEIPANSVLLVPLRAILHHPRYWKDPEKFDPYREEFQQKPGGEVPNEATGLTMPYKLGRYPFIPFSEGRECPARDLMQVMFYTFLNELTKYDLKLTGKQHVEVLPALIKVARLEGRYYAMLNRRDSHERVKRKEEEKEEEKEESVCPFMRFTS